MVIGENDSDDDACAGFEDSEVEDAVESRAGVEFEDLLEEEDVLTKT